MQLKVCLLSLLFLFFAGHILFGQKKQFALLPDLDFDSFLLKSF
jgi:hypothetical protein